MIKTIRTDSTDYSFLKLIHQLDDDLAQKNGEKNNFFKKFNHVDKINHVIIIFKNEIPIGCGAFKIYNEQTVEIKRMFVDINNRKRGFATTILNELTNWANELGFHYAVLETGDKMTEAINLYLKKGFEIIPNYPPYDEEPTSRCFKKKLSN